MIMPERTVDAWTASYITGRRWRARLWAPTERSPDEGYDVGVGLGNVGAVPGYVDRDHWPDKVFVLEHKGVDETSAGLPVIGIRLRQLLSHYAADRARGGGLVYYLLPDPSWRGRQPAPYGTVPAVAARRTRGATWDGFQRWAVVAHVEDVVAAARSLYVSNRSRFKHRPPRGGRRDDWTCALTMSEVWAIPRRTTLRDFVSGVRDCTYGRLVTDPAVVGPVGPGPGGPPDAMGPSPGGLGPVLGVDSAAPPVEGGDDVVATDLPDHAFDRLAATTFYGIGDNEAAEGND